MEAWQKSKTWSFKKTCKMESVVEDCWLWKTWAESQCEAPGWVKLHNGSLWLVCRFILLTAMKVEVTGIVCLVRKEWHSPQQKAYPSRVCPWPFFCSEHDDFDSNGATWKGLQVLFLRKGEFRVWCFQDAPSTTHQRVCWRGPSSWGIGWKWRRPWKERSGSGCWTIEKNGWRAGR